MSDLDKAPIPKAGIMQINAYKAGGGQFSGVEKLYHLASNETPHGAPQQARDAVAELANNIHEYPDPGSTKLRDAIAKKHGLNADKIVCSNGSDELLTLIANGYIAEGDEAIISQYGFLVYKNVIQANGGIVVVADEVDFTVDVDNMLACVTDKTKVVYLANPGNPTGTYIGAGELNRLHKGLRSDIILVIDSAYAEFCLADDYHDGVDLVEANENVIMTRTFSKLYGLAGLRVGWCYASDGIIAVLSRIRGPFNVNATAQVAGAAAVFADDFVKMSLDHNVKWAGVISQRLSGLGIKVTPTHANFMLIHFDGTGKTAEEADRYLCSKGVVLRRLEAYNIPNALRYTIGSDEANELVLSLLETFMKL
ncbi:MAG: histidinol-phosphate transaminase [Hyphomicrobiales bacterium]|nr:MAG: histidinol-phosphate transaminase [Hyphomicrobiales bacterium]